MTKNVNIAKILDQATTFAVSAAMGANVIANLTTIQVSNSLVNTTIGNNSIYVGNSTANATHNATNFAVSAINSTSVGVLVANNLITIGNSSVNALINSTTFNATANNALSLGGTAAASYQLNSTLSANVATLSANNATWHGTSVFANSTGAYPTSNSVGAVLGNTISRVIITGNSATFISTLAAGDTTITGFVNATVSVSVGANVQANTTSIIVGNSTTNTLIGNNSVDIGNSTINTFANSILVKVANSTANSIVTPGSFFTGNSIANVVANSITITVANATGFSQINPSYMYNGNGATGVLQTAGVGFWYGNNTTNVTSGTVTPTTPYFPVANSTSSANLTPIGLVTGTTVVNTIAAALGIVTAGNTSVTGFVNATVSVNSAAHTIGTTFIANTLGVYHTGTMNAASFTTTGFLANATHVVPTSNSSGQTFGNTISRWVITGNSATFSSTLAAGDTTITGFVNATVSVNSAALTTAGFRANATHVVPTSNSSGQSFGNTISRWVITANTIDTSGAVTFGTTANVGALQINTTAIIIGAGIINATNYNATANNALYLGGTIAANYLKADTADQTITGGSRVTVNDLGTKTTGTVTVDPGDRPMQKYTNGGAHTLAPGTDLGYYILDIINTTGAGAITTSGWTKVSGDSFDTTTTSKFRCYCSVTGDFSLLQVTKAV